MSPSKCRSVFACVFLTLFQSSCIFSQMEVGPEKLATGGDSRSSTGGVGAATTTGATSTGSTSTSTAQGGTAANGSTGGVTAAGGVATVAGAPATSTGSGCTGNLELPAASIGLCVAKPVTITNTTTATSFSIDATEVTRGQYEAWLATAPALAPKTDVTCGTNASYVPLASCMASAQVCKTNCNSHPMVCVDWCDAQAYCSAVGKRLCGKIGGGANPFSDLASADASAWYRVCSAAVGNAYPYGNTYSGTSCNGSEYWPSTTPTTVPVASLEACQPSVAGYAGVFDLSGNVMEWEDCCASTGSAASCRLRGGSFEENTTALGCSYGFSYVRTTNNLRIGFRCCSL